VGNKTHASVHCGTKHRLPDAVADFTIAMPVRQELSKSMSWRLDLAVSQGRYPPIENEAIGNYTSHVCEEGVLADTRTEFGLVDFAGPLLLTFVGAAGPRRAGRSSALRVSYSRTVLHAACRQRGGTTAQTPFLAVLGAGSVVVHHATAALARLQKPEEGARDSARAWRLRRRRAGCHRRAGGRLGADAAATTALGGTARAGALARAEPLLRRQPAAAGAWAQCLILDAKGFGHQRIWTPKDLDTNGN
jgi:hypothetical protein